MSPNFIVNVLQLNNTLLVETGEICYLYTQIKIRAQTLQ